MVDQLVSADETYSSTVGLLFIFNLIVGTGALALPKSFQIAGYGASILLTHISCITSYICATFVVECMAIANVAHLRAKRQEAVEDPDEVVEPADSYKIKSRIEVSQMAKLFFARTGLILSYILLVLYLFGDLTIYSATISKSIMNLMCDSVNSSVTESDLCWRNKAGFFDRRTVYRIAIFSFTLLAAPMVLAGITKTKYLQISTSACRWTAFILMILLASLSLIRDGPESSPRFADHRGFGSLFGTTVYAFMCHHSLPGIITPMRRKQHVMIGIGIVYAVILLFYITLSMTGSYAFEQVFDVYTLNFLHDEDTTTLFNKILNYFLALFPVFTLSTNYPIVANTLVNNLCVLFDMFLPHHNSPVNEERQSLLTSDNNSGSSALPVRIRYTKNYLRYCCVLVVILIPMGISLTTNNVLLLASLTGSYPGVGIQYVIPSLLILYARRYNKKEFGVPVPSDVSSPFKSAFWPLAMLVWSTLAIFMVTVNLFGLY